MSPEAVAAAPRITDILKESRGGLKFAFESMRFSEAPLILQFFEAYDQIPLRDQERLSIEAVAVKAGINVRHLWGEIMLAMREHSVTKVKMLAVGAHPEVTARRVKVALTNDGYRDRDALDMMLGALPAKGGGSTFIGKFFASGAKEVQDLPAEVKTAEVVTDEPVSDLDYIFPNSEDVQERVQTMNQKMLEAPK